MNQAQVKKALQSLPYDQLCHRYFPAYVSLKYPEYRWAPHNRAIAKALMKVERGDINRLMIFMPPRHGKTMQVSEYFPAWYLGRNPADQIIACTYSKERAGDTGRKVRNQFLDPIYHKVFPHSGLSTDAKAVHSMATEVGGLFYSVGTGGAVTGRGANLFLIDDPVKSREDAESATSRQKLNDWFQGVAYTRLMPKNAIILVMTRWHFSDLAGFLLDELGHEKWAMLKLPAMCDSADDLLGRQPGEALWKSDFPVKTLEHIRETIGTREWNAQYQQTPLPAEGGMVDLNWFKKYDYVEWLAFITALRMGGEPEMPFGIKYIVQSWDTAFKEKQLNDPSAATVWGCSDTDAYLLETVNKRMVYPKLKQTVRKLHEKWARLVKGQVRVLVEDKASGQSLIQDLQFETKIPVLPQKADSNKQVRMSSGSPLIEAGKIWLPERAPWLVEYETQIARFPLADNDDLADSTSQFLNWFGKPKYRRRNSPLFWK